MSNRNTALLSAALFIGAIALCYAICAFINMELNPAEWAKSDRATAAAAASFIGGWLAGAPWVFR
jgi:hypothetical protein